MKTPITSTHRAGVAAVVATALAVAACGDRERDAAGSRAISRTPTGSAAPSGGASSSPAPPSPAAPTIPAMAAADRDFVMTAASGDTFEVEASRMALDKTQSAAVRTFAQQTVDDHTRTSEQLRAIARAAGVTVMMSMNAEHSADLERLRVLNGRAFDREYAAQIGVAAHQEAVALFEQTSSSATDVQLKSFAEQTLPHLREHLQQAQALARQVGVPADRMKLANAAGAAASSSVDDTGTGNSAGGATERAGTSGSDAASPSRSSLPADRPGYSGKPAPGG